MTTIAVILFAIAAAVGAMMAVQRLRGEPLPATGTALAHGGAAALALVLYVIATLGAETAPATAWWAIGLFVVAALGGATLFLGFHLRERDLPVPLVLVHGGVAVVAFALLLVAAFSG